jgi:hypothetical protein
MRVRLQAEMAEPAILARAEAVHGTVQMHGGNGLMSVEDARERLLVVHARRALVVDDDVVALGPVGFLIQRQRWVGAFVIGPDHIDLNIGAALDAFGDDLVLFCIVMAAATGDQESFQRFGRAHRNAEGEDG